MSKKFLKPEEKPVYQGYLYKTAKMIGRSPQKRWCCLYRPWHLYYFEREDSTFSLGILDLRDIVGIEPINKKKKNGVQYMLHIHTTRKIQVWIANTQEEATRWYEELWTMSQSAKAGMDPKPVPAGSNSVRTPSESALQFQRNTSVASLGGSVNSRLGMSTNSTVPNGTNASSTLGYSLSGPSVSLGNSGGTTTGMSVASTAIGGPTDSWIIDPTELNFDEGKVLGKGSFGCVQLATWRGSNVAVKTLFGAVGASSDDFFHELAMLGRLHHPNIVQLLGYCSTGGSNPTMAKQCLVTEYLPGGSLSQYLTDLKNQNQPLDFRLMLNIAMDTCKGMICLHAEKPPIIHRDLKTANILLVSTSSTAPVNAKVADFGIATEHRQTSEHTRHQGTFIYMAPEVFSSENYTVKVDVFSFGLILWEMLSLERPWKEFKFQFQIEEAIVKGVRPFIPDFCPPLLRELINGCWSGSPVDRPDFIDILKKLKALAAEYPLPNGNLSSSVSTAPNSLQNTGATQTTTSVTVTPIILRPPVEASYGDHADKLLKNLYEGKEMTTWTEFTNEFGKVLHSRPNDLLKIKPLVCDEGGNVPKRLFINFLKWFAPLNEEDEIYEGGKEAKLVEGGTSVAEIRTLLTQPWFHGMIDSNTTMNRLQSQQSGTYLIRFSGSEPGNYALSMNDGGKIRHWKIVVTKAEGRVFTVNSKSFPSLPAIVSQSNYDFLETKMGAAPMLKFPCPKTDEKS